MDLPILSTAAAGLAFVMVSPEQASLAPSAEGAAALVGSRLYASEAPIARWGEPVRAEELRLEDLGRVAAVIEDEAGLRHVVVEVGGLWGLGAQEVEVGPERLHLVRDAGGADRLVVDLSAEGTAPVES